MPHPTQLSATDTALLVVDVQEKLVPKILDADAMVLNTAFLIDACKLLQMPVLATEQYPKGLGPTVSPLRERLPERPDKVAFSCCAVGSVVDTLHREARPKVVLAGIETGFKKGQISARMEGASHMVVPDRQSPMVKLDLKMKNGDVCPAEVYFNGFDDKNNAVTLVRFYPANAP